MRQRPRGPGGLCVTCFYGTKPHIYRAIYEISEREKTVCILTVRHGAMDAARPDELQ